VQIGPDCACTAYSSQGLTLDAAIVDLLFSECTNPATAYVALSRVRSANDILIMQAFKRVLFTKGIPVGPRLLLKKLRKEDIAADLQEHIQVTCKQYLALVVTNSVLQEQRAQRLLDATAKDDEAKAKAQAKKADRNRRYRSKESSQKRRREAAAQMSPEARARAKEKRREAAAQISPEAREAANKLRRQKRQALDK
jgi:hypothetical protein